MEYSYLAKATELRKSKGDLKEELLNHISPLGWEHINFLGEYKFDIRQMTTLKNLRPLNNTK